MNGGREVVIGWKISLDLDDEDEKNNKILVGGVGWLIGWLAAGCLLLASFVALGFYSS